MVGISGKRWKNEQFRWQFAVFLLANPLIAPVAGCSGLASTDTPGEPYGNLIGMTVILCAFYDGMTMIHAGKKGPLVRLSWLPCNLVFVETLMQPSIGGPISLSR